MTFYWTGAREHGIYLLNTWIHHHLSIGKTKLNGEALIVVLTFIFYVTSRFPDGKLLTSVYRKPTHTDQYLVYDSHHPQSVKRGIVKCLHDRAERIITKPSETAQDKKQLSSPTATLRPSYRRWPKPGIQHQRGKQQNSSPPQCCHTSKESQNPSAATYSNKEYAPSLNPTPH